VKKIILYELFWLILIIVFYLINQINKFPQWYVANLQFINCALIGALGGIIYCLRGIYINKCVRKNWDDNWNLWYYLRPLTSLISGFISCIFLKAGLLTLDVSEKSGGIYFGYFAVAFIAGYNVDNFLKKLEAIAHSAWGIDKSNSSK
jgi:formate hydrogenlyase subunit 3/multisubunit Na+/H+ antiporter MnhD subunit